MVVLNIIPVGPDRPLETCDFFLDSKEVGEAERETIRYLDEVLQVENIASVENVQKGMNAPAFSQGRIVNDPEKSGKSEHAVHHFHGLVLEGLTVATPDEARQRLRLKGADRVAF